MALAFTSVFLNPLDVEADEHLSRQRCRQRKAEVAKPGIGCDCVLHFPLKLRLQIRRQTYESSREAFAIILPTKVLLTLSGGPGCRSLAFALERSMRPTEPDERELWELKEDDTGGKWLVLST
jgi:hypothetical protein